MALTTTSYAVLGLLSIAPMSGYDLHQAVDRSVRHLWPISKSHVYAELARLEPLGLIAATDVPQERLPDKRVFRLTEMGEETLDEWLLGGEFEAPQFRLPFLLPALFGHRLGPERIGELLEHVKAGAETRRRDFQALLDAMESAPGTEYARLVVLHGVRLAEATAAWADEAAARLPAHPVRIDPRRPRPQTAATMFRIAPAATEAGVE